MSTVIELYDKQPIYNVLITSVLKPERIVYVVDFDCGENGENCALSYLETLSPPVETVFYKTDTNDIDSVLSALTEITNTYPDCVLDVTGGEDLLLLAAGMFCTSHNLPVCYFNKKTKKYINVFKSEHIVTDGEVSGFKINDFIRLSGGLMAGHGHFSVSGSGLSDKELDFMCSRALQYQKHWKAMVLGLQQYKNLNDELFASVPLYVAGSKAQSGILYDFASDGLISDLAYSANRVTFRYKNSSVKKIMTDTGTWLELFIFIEARKQNFFTDLSMSVLIDWNGSNGEKTFKQSEEPASYSPVIVPSTTNEIDVIAVKGINPLFISCKAGNYNAKEIKAEINIIHTIAKRFGGENAIPVLVTASELSKIDRYLFKRCEDMGVYVIESSDLRIGKTGKRLVEIAQK